MNRNFKINNIFCEEQIPDKIEQVIIYCHGFGETKKGLNYHKDILNKNNIGIISFDFPCHGDDKSKDNQFNLSNCLVYLKNLIEYSKRYNVPISLIGESFGGYVILCYVNLYKENFHRIFLKYPAINFYECTKRRLKIDDSYFNENDYFVLLNGKKLYKKTYYEFKENDIINDFNKYNNEIFIIHGDHDKTVLIDDIKLFSDKNNIKLKIVKNAEHGMKNQIELINNKLINFIK